MKDEVFASMGSQLIRFALTWLELYSMPYKMQLPLLLLLPGKWKDGS
jgi:hypothetical protein